MAKLGTPGTKGAKFKKALDGSKDIQELKDIVEQMDDPNKGYTDEVKVEDLIPDPLNIRDFNMSLDKLKGNVAAEDEEEQKEIDDILTLAKSMEDEVQIQDITVFYNDKKQKYQIIAGERRYWAAKLIGLERLRAYVFREMPKNKTTIQFVENFQRKQLPLHKTVKALVRMVKEHNDEQKDDKDSVITEYQDLEKHFYLSRTSAWRFWQYIQMSEKDRIQYIYETKETSHTPLLELLGHSKAEEKESANAARKKERRAGRPVSKVKLGASNDIAVIQELIKRVDTEASVKGIGDILDLKELQRIWNDLIKGLEKSLKQ